MSTTALAVIQPDELETMQRTARLLAVSAYFDAKGDTPVAIAQIATKILAGRELGFGPFASVNGIHIINGRPAIGANLMAMAVKNSPRYDYRVRELTDTVCKIEFFEYVSDRREPLGFSTFTADDGRKAGTKNLDKFPRNMLFARAMSNGIRWYCPDVFAGNVVYVPEELGAEVDGDGNVIDASPIMPEPEKTAQNGGSTSNHTGDTASASQQLATPATEPNSNGSETPIWQTVYARLEGECRRNVDYLRRLDKQGGPSSDTQHGALVGRIDEICGQNAHRDVLAAICGREVTKQEPESAAAAAKLLGVIVEEFTVAGEKKPNENYKPEVVQCVKHIWTLCLESRGQATLIAA